jgi:hypothetical protein
MSNNDELLFGEARRTATATDGDSDGDGVSDDQERLDGTDPNDAADSIRHREPVVWPSDDPRGDLNELTLERESVVDVAGAVPAGHTLDQVLPTGLDGQKIDGGPNHYLNDDAETFMAGRADGALSPLDMQRDPTIETIVPTADTGRDSTTDTLGREAGPATGSQSTFDSGGDRGDLPLGETPSGSSDPGNNPDLVSQNSTPGQLAGLVQNPFGGGEATKKETPREKFMRESGKGTDGGTATPTLPEYKKPNYQDPDAAGGTVVVTPEDIEAAIVRNDGVTDFVEGYGGGAQIEGDAPPTSPRDLVTDPGDEDPGAVGDSFGTITAPGGEISKPVNPMDGIGPVRDPSPGAPIGGGGGEPDPHQLEGISSAATAAESSSTDSGISAVGGDAGDGIHSLAGNTTDTTVTANIAADTTTNITGRPFTDTSGVPEPSIRPTGGDDSNLDITGVGSGEPIDLVITGPRTVASTGGDDDDLEELCVIRETNPDAEDGSLELDTVELRDGRLRDVAVDRPALQPDGPPDVVGGDHVASEGPGTQTEDEIYIGMVDPDGGGSDGGAGGSGAPSVVATVGAPVTTVQIVEPIAEPMPAPLDPVTELIAAPPVQLFETEDSFAASAVEPEPVISEVLDDDDL